MLCLSLLAACFGTKAQTVSTFEALPLATPDTYYVNYSQLGADVGFGDGLAYFPCVYDTAWGLQLWISGFAYSNMTDSTTPDYTNMYAARPAKGHDSSDQYVVAWDVRNVVHLTGAAAGKPVRGFYATNSTYAYFSMRDGDGFSSPFSGANHDWAKITVRGYLGGTQKNDSVDFYLADFRSADSTEHYIVDTWEWVDLLPLGNVDSLEFVWSASDIMKPAYFCMDDFTTDETAGITQAASAIAAKVYPNPAAGQLFVESAGQDISDIRLFDMSGKLLGQYAASGRVTAIPTAALPAGMYLLMLQGDDRTMATVRFQKQ